MTSENVTSLHGRDVTLSQARSSRERMADLRRRTALVIRGFFKSGALDAPFRLSCLPDGVRALS